MSNGRHFVPSMERWANRRAPWFDLAPSDSSVHAPLFPITVHGDKMLSLSDDRRTKSEPDLRAGMVGVAACQNG